MLLGSWKQSVDLFADHKWYQTMFHVRFPTASRRGGLCSGLRVARSPNLLRSNIGSVKTEVFCVFKASLTVSLCKPPGTNVVLVVSLCQILVLHLRLSSNNGCWGLAALPRPPTAAAPTSVQHSTGYLHREMGFTYEVQQVSLVWIWFLKYSWQLWNYKPVEGGRKT